jgi:single-strand DNA-binding protein
MNQVMLIGNLGNDPQTRFSESGVQINNASLAVSDPFKQADGTWGFKTYWMRLVAFGKSAEKLAMFPKGSRIMVSGKIQTGSYEKDDGTMVYTTDIICKQVQGIVKMSLSASKEDYSEPEFSTEDIPF